MCECLKQHFCITYYTTGIDLSVASSAFPSRSGSALSTRTEWNEYVTALIWRPGPCYGFIAPAGSEDIADNLYFNLAEWHDDSEPKRGMAVSFIEAIGRKDGRPFAREVRLINGAGAVIVDAKPID